MTETTFIPAFDAQARLHDGWKVEHWEPGLRLALSQSPDEALRRIKRQLGVVAVSVFMGALLLPDFTGKFFLSPFFVLPISALFFLVAMLGLWSLTHSYRAYREGIQLILDAQTQTVTGTSSLLRFKKTKVPFSQINRILIRVLPASKPQDPALSELIVDSQDKKTQLTGPSSWALENDVSSARDALTPVALEMARLIGCGLRIEYVDTHESDQLSREEVAQYPVRP